MATSKPPAAAEAPSSRGCAASECSNEFTPVRKAQIYCSKTCRQRAARARKAAEHAAEVDRRSEDGTGGAEHDLVKATRSALEKASALDTVDGQIALQLARKLTDPEISGFDRLAQTLRTVLADALGAKPPAGPAEEPDPDADLPDEVKRARARRDAAREAAGQA